MSSDNTADECLPVLLVPVEGLPETTIGVEKHDIDIDSFTSVMLYDY